MGIWLNYSNTINRTISGSISSNGSAKNTPFLQSD